MKREKQNINSHNIHQHRENQISRMCLIFIEGNLRKKKNMQINRGYRCNYYEHLQYKRNFNIKEIMQLTIR